MKTCDAPLTEWERKTTLNSPSVRAWIYEALGMDEIDLVRGAQAYVNPASGEVGIPAGTSADGYNKGRAAAINARAAHLLGREDNDTFAKEFEAWLYDPEYGFGAMPDAMRGMDTAMQEAGIQRGLEAARKILMPLRKQINLVGDRANARNIDKVTRLMGASHRAKYWNVAATIKDKKWAQKLSNFAHAGASASSLAQIGYAAIRRLPDGDFQFTPRQGAIGTDQIQKRILQDLGEKRAADFWHYLVAKSDSERSGKKLDSYTRDRWLGNLPEKGTAERAKWDALEGMIRRFHRQQREYQVATKQVDEATKQAWEVARPNYFPLTRYGETAGMGYRSTGQADSVLADPVDAFLENATIRNARGVSNMLTHMLADRLVMNGGARIATKLSKAAARENAPEAILSKALNESNEQRLARVRGMFAFLQETGGFHQSPSGKRYLYYSNGGETAALQINDMATFDSLYAMKPVASHAFIKAANKVRQVSQASTTLYPVWQVQHMFRELGYFLLLHPYGNLGLPSVGDMTKGIQDAFDNARGNKNEFVAELLYNGAEAQLGVIIGQDLDTGALSKTANKISNKLSAGRDFIRFPGLAMRHIAARSALRAGKDMSEMVYAFNHATGDFRNRGSSRGLEEAKKAVLFLRSTMGGIDTAYSRIKGEQLTREEAMRIRLKIGLATLAAFAYGYNILADDEDYQQLSPRDKVRGVHWVDPVNGGIIFTIRNFFEPSIPIQAGLIAGDYVRRVGDKENPAAARALGQDLFAIFGENFFISPSSFPIVGAAGALAWNQDPFSFAPKDVISQREKALPASAHTGSSLARMMALNLEEAGLPAPSPKKVDRLIASWFGAGGSAALRATDWALFPEESTSPRGGVAGHLNPIWHYTSADRPQQDLYDMAKRGRKEWNNLRETARRGEVDRLEAIAKEIEKDPDIRRNILANRIISQKSWTDISLARRLAGTATPSRFAEIEKSISESNDDYPPVAGMSLPKRRRILADFITGQQREVAKNALKWLREKGGGRAEGNK